MIVLDISCDFWCCNARKHFSKAQIRLISSHFVCSSFVCFVCAISTWKFYYRFEKKRMKNPSGRLNLFIYLYVHFIRSVRNLNAIALASRTFISFVWIDSQSFHIIFQFYTNEWVSVLAPLYFCIPEDFAILNNFFCFCAPIMKNEMSIFVSICQHS